LCLALRPERIKGVTLKEPTQSDRALAALAAPGRVVFALANLALGIETLIFARANGLSDGFAPDYKVIPVLPFLPTIPWLAYLFGAVVVVFGACVLLKRGLKPAALLLGALWFISGLLLDGPKYAAHLGDMGYRTCLFEPWGMAALACLLPGRDAIPSLLDRVSRYLLAICLIIFGVDHFLALAPIGSLIPNWIPWHVFWIAFFGAVFVASGISIALNRLLPWGAAGLGLMFAIWVFTLHIPRALRVPSHADEWSSLFIAIAYWGGPWALAGLAARQKRSGEESRLQLQPDRDQSRVEAR